MLPFNYGMDPSDENIFVMMDVKEELLRWSDGKGPHHPEQISFCVLGTFRYFETIKYKQLLVSITD